ncbi:DUF2304 domain-containing protein [Pengzhenrongella frigida]|uniref:DUF2304 domain-containing protein n=1 Tax=Pengzhenrongella frigida TaxID=1259133 RepID=A0A4Q5N010_9MICO|nr:DUF2304 domain-containing protein [Cellulomonas sp. HLT2-17]RYV51378.1 DUF2304 domain-containing protein [Cellulomonas sp. HLT2-17]
MSAYATVVLVCLLLVGSLVYLLRTRRIREKYAAIWIVLTVAVLLIGAFPQLAFWLSSLVGVRTPANLVFAIAIVVLLAVCIQLSTEISNLEEETRTLAQEIALQRLEARRDREAVLLLLPPAASPPVEAPDSEDV